MEPNEVLAKIWDAAFGGELIARCAWCGRVRIEEEWLEPPPWALSTIDEQTTFSHSICPRCAEGSAARFRRISSKVKG